MVFSGFYHPVFTRRAQGTYYSLTISILLHQIFEPLYLFVVQPIVQRNQISISQWRLGLPTFIKDFSICFKIVASTYLLIVLEGTDN